VSVSGKFFRMGQERWHLRGLTYGPFPPDRADGFLPDARQRCEDFSLIRDMGANAVRLYHPPPRELLDEALHFGLRVLIDVPWEKHRCFFEDWSSQHHAIEAVRTTAAELGGHPAVLGVSVANEIPPDVVRFYGSRRIEKFISNLLAEVKEQAPDCLATYTNYPPTEFLNPAGSDFACFNVYLEDADALGRYLDRLQHVVGRLPLILGEFGLDSFRNGEMRQAAVLEQHVEQVFRRGLAGSFVFAFTDEWFTGGCRIEDWAFGITACTRKKKPAAHRLEQVWSRVPCLDRSNLPEVSVVVCSYNGGATLRECLESLVLLNYPNYEIILVDDGSTDDTPQIAADFPTVRYVRQDNAGLSAARNIGALRARGEVVAYTDSDCVADENWLLYLVHAMQDQGVNAIGGPNITPPSDGWTAQCVAASPGNPGHVMLDDRFAEHVPGCNMAFHRDTLLNLGGFDVQFQQAGDDVDICWRFLDAGLKIGYASAAVVWHHRRRSVREYLRQQRGYGRSEGMLQFKHPQRFNSFGCSRWNGIIYGEGAAGLPVVAPLVHHGRFGSALFQMVYRTNRYTPLVYATLLEWHALSAALLLLSLFSPGLAAVGGLMIIGSLAAAVYAGRKALLPGGSPWWSRPLVGVLHLLQPIVRGWSRYAYRFSNKRIPLTGVRSCPTSSSKWISWRQHDLYWQQDQGRGREHLLEALVSRARKTGWQGDFDAEWKSHDLELIGGLWHKILIRTVSEELGAGKRFTRARIVLAPSRLTWAAAATCLLLTGALVGGGLIWAAVLPWAALGVAVVRNWRGCRWAAIRLIWQSGVAAGLEPVVGQGETSGVRAQTKAAVESVAA